MSDYDAEARKYLSYQDRLLRAHERQAVALERIAHYIEDTWHKVSEALGNMPAEPDDEEQELPTYGVTCDDIKNPSPVQREDGAA